MQLHTLAKKVEKSEPEPKSDEYKWIAVLVLVAAILIAMAIFGVNPNG